MSARKRRRTRSSPQPASPRPEENARSAAKKPAQRRCSPRTAIILSAAALLLLSVLAGLRFMRQRDASSAALDLPPLPASTDTIAAADFVGSDTCAECHAAEFSAWQGSTHGRAGGDPAEIRLLRAFDGRPIRFRDATVTPRRDASSRYVFEIDWAGRAREVIPVDGVIGGGHMVGGGTQGFVWRAPDGTVRFLPFEMTRVEDAWFCNTNTRLDSGWLPITSAMRLADCGDWPPIRVLGQHGRLATCQECHGSQIRTDFRNGQASITAYTSLDINCESCHGPGRRHAELARASDAAANPDLAMPSLAVLDRDASLEVCFRCHALKDALATGFLPGKPLEEYYSLLMPWLSEDAPVHPDGRIRTFAYQQGHLWSDCYVSGSMTCTDCHDPHSQQYRDANGQPLTGRFADGQCTGCHPSKAERPEAHTHHAPASPGSRCVSCHMPYLQEPEVGARLRYARSDHVIPLPRPGFDAGLGVEVACQTCHRDTSAEALDQQTTEWWGELKPLPPAVRAMIALQAGERTAVDSLLLVPAGNHTAAEFMLLAALVRDRLQPDTAPEDARILERLKAAAASENADIAALGLAALHYSAAADRRVREQLEQRASQLGASARAVRSRWAVILGYLADQHRENGEWDSAIQTYRKALNVRAAHSATRMNLGLAFAGKGQPDSARAAYLESIRDDPRNSLAHVNLGILLAAQGDEAGAIAAYQQALQIDPFDGLAWFNLGNVHLRAGRADQAAQAYAKATQLGPAIAQAYFNRARALIALGRLEDAANALRTGLEFQHDANAAAALRELETRTTR